MHTESEDRKGPLERFRCRRTDNTKMDLNLYEPCITHLWQTG